MKTHMTDPANFSETSLPIALVERETGVSKDALRVWERRYGFPNPTRGASGERMYPAAQVEQLRIIKRLLDDGHRPGRTVGLTLPVLKSLSGASPLQRGGESTVVSADVEQCTALVRGNDVVGLRRQLAHVLVTRGLVRCIDELIAPLNVAIGDSWMRGEIEVFQEHAYSQAVSALLRGAIDLVPHLHALGRPRVLLTTLTNEPHALGLLMAEAILALEGCECLSLGTETPVVDICNAAVIHRIDVVALSFTGVIGTRQMAQGVARLRQGLPASTEIWVGGQFALVNRKHFPQARIVGTLDSVQQQVHAWRAAHPQPTVRADAAE